MGFGKRSYKYKEASYRLLYSRKVKSYAKIRYGLECGYSIEFHFFHNFVFKAESILPNIFPLDIAPRKIALNNTAIPYEPRHKACRGFFCRIIGVKTITHISKLEDGKPADTGCPESPILRAYFGG